MSFIITRQIFTPDLERIIDYAFQGHEQSAYLQTLAHVLKSYEAPLRLGIARGFSEPTVNALNELLSMRSENREDLKSQLCQLFPENFPHEPSVDDYFEMLRRTIPEDVTVEFTGTAILPSEIEEEASIYCKILILQFKDLCTGKNEFNVTTTEESYQLVIDQLDENESTHLKTIALNINIISSLGHASKVSQWYMRLLKLFVTNNDWNINPLSLELMAMGIIDLHDFYQKAGKPLNMTISRDFFYAITNHIQDMLNSDFFAPVELCQEFEHAREIMNSITAIAKLSTPFDFRLKDCIERISNLAKVYERHSPFLQESIPSERALRAFYEDYIAAGIVMPRSHQFEQRMALIMAKNSCKLDEHLETCLSMAITMYQNASTVITEVVKHWNETADTFQQSRKTSEKMRTLLAIKAMKSIFNAMRTYHPHKSTLEHLCMHECLLLDPESIIKFKLSTLHDLGNFYLTKTLFNIDYDESETISSILNKVMTKFRQLNPFEMNDAELADQYRVMKILSVVIKIYYYHEERQSCPEVMIKVLELLDEKHARAPRPETPSATSAPLTIQAPSLDMCADRAQQRAKYLNMILFIFLKKSSDLKLSKERATLACEQTKLFFKYCMGQLKEKLNSELMTQFVSEFLMWLSQSNVQIKQLFHSALSPLFSENFYEEIRGLRGEARETCISLEIQKSDEFFLKENYLCLPDYILQNKVERDNIHFMIVTLFTCDLQKRSGKEKKQYIQFLNSLIEKLAASKTLAKPLSTTV